MRNLSFKRHRFPAEVITNSIWLYARFTLSLRDVEEMFAERGLDVSYETVRRWFLKFGSIIAANLKRARPKPSDHWHLEHRVRDAGGLVPVGPPEAPGSEEARLGRASCSSSGSRLVADHSPDRCDEIEAEGLGRPRSQATAQTSRSQHRNRCGHRAAAMLARPASPDAYSQPAAMAPCIIAFSVAVADPLAVAIGVAPAIDHALCQAMDSPTGIARPEVLTGDRCRNLGGVARSQLIG